jgi:hypothetical protein
VSLQQHLFAGKLFGMDGGVAGLGIPWEVGAGRRGWMEGNFGVARDEYVCGRLWAMSVIFDFRWVRVVEVLSAVLI